MRFAAPLVVTRGGIAVLLCALAGVLVPGGGAAAAQAASGRSALVPLVVCPTSFGVSPGKRPAFPTLTTLAVATPLSGSLAAYTDTQGSMTVIAPRGWRCSATYGADGSGGVRVFPRGHASAGETIVGGETSACYGCTTGQACALFAAAARAYRSSFPGACPVRRPARETIARLSSTVVAFEDPPHIRGEGVGSGGALPANGVITYLPGNASGSWLETCTLPAALHSTCTVILDDFLARYRSR